MSKYIVVRMSMAEMGGEEDGWLPKAVAPCETASEVADQLLLARQEGDDWSVWEAVGKKTERRSVSFPYDKERATIA